MVGLAILQGLDIRLDAEVQLVDLGQNLGELLQLGSILCPLLRLVSKLLELDFPVILNFVELLNRGLRETTLEGDLLAALDSCC